jgi:hypothetical protein
MAFVAVRDIDHVTATAQSLIDSLRGVAVFYHRARTRLSRSCRGVAVLWIPDENRDSR